MEAIRTEKTNKNLTHESCIDLPAEFDGNHLIMCWELTDDEVAEIIKTRKIYHAIWTDKPCMQPVWLGTSEPVFDTEDPSTIN